VLVVDDEADLLITYELPDGDGFQLVRAARAAPRPMPIIIVTGVPSEDRRRAAMTAGAAAFLAKAFRTSPSSSSSNPRWCTRATDRSDESRTGDGARPSTCAWRHMTIRYSGAVALGR
jgi:DNA-binding NtrC family response regulator